jgi:hypothetical protein
MSAELTVPEGFVPYAEPGPFLERLFRSTEAMARILDS